MRSRAKAHGKPLQRGAPAFNAFAKPAQRAFRGGAYAAPEDDDFDEGYGEAVFRPGQFRGAIHTLTQDHTRGGGRGKRGGNFQQPTAAPLPAQSMEELLSCVHDAIGKSVWDAVGQIMHLEPNWSEDQLSKRIVKYIYKSASDEKLLDMEWDQLCENLTKGMFHGFSSSCGESEWFHTIDLAPALSAAALVLLPAAGWHVSPQQAHHTVLMAYQHNLDRRTLEKVLWEMVQNLFDDEKVRTKIFNAISRSFEPARERARNDLTPQEEITRVETFMKSWIDDCACRAWGGLGDQAEEYVNHETLVQMFDHVLQPFGDDHPFSAVPREFTETMGAPPPGWDFIPQAVEDLFNNWAASESMPKKRRKKGGGDDDASFEALEAAADPDGDEEQEAKPAKKKVSKRAAAQKIVKSEGAGHPECTSGEDCAGAPEDGLMQHVLEDGPGDIYCSVCWKSFRQRNSDLEGVPVEA